MSHCTVTNKLPNPLNCSSVIYVVTTKDRPIKALKIDESGNPCIVNVSDVNTGQCSSVEPFNVYDECGRIIEDLVVEEQEFSVKENGDVIAVPSQCSRSSFDSAETDNGILLRNGQSRESNSYNNTSSSAFRRSDIPSLPITCIFNYEKDRYDVNDCFQAYVVCDRLSASEIQRLSSSNARANSLEKTNHQSSSSDCSLLHDTTALRPVVSFNSSCPLDSQVTIPADVSVFGDNLPSIIKSADSSSAASVDSLILLSSKIEETHGEFPVSAESDADKRSSSAQGCADKRINVTKVSDVHNNWSLSEQCAAQVVKNSKVSSEPYCVEAGDLLCNLNVINNENELFESSNIDNMVQLDIVDNGINLCNCSVVVDRDAAPNMNDAVIANVSCQLPTGKTRKSAAFVNAARMLCESNIKDAGDASIILIDSPSANTLGAASFIVDSETVNVSFESPNTVAGDDDSHNVNSAAVSCESASVDAAGDAESMFDTGNVLCDLTLADTDDGVTVNMENHNISSELLITVAVDTRPIVVTRNASYESESPAIDVAADASCDQSGKFDSYLSCEADDDNYTDINRDYESSEEWLTDECNASYNSIDIDVQDSCSLDKYKALCVNLSGKIDELEKLKISLLTRLEVMESRTLRVEPESATILTVSDNLNDIPPLECRKAKLQALEDELRARADTLNKEEEVLDQRKKKLEEHVETLEQLRVKLEIDEDRIIHSELSRQQEEIIVNFELNRLNLLHSGIEREKKFRVEENKRLLLRHKKVSVTACDSNDDVVSSKVTPIAIGSSKLSKECVETVVGRRNKQLVSCRKRRSTEEAVDTTGIYSKKQSSRDEVGGTMMSRDGGSERINLFSQVKSWFNETLTGLRFGD